MSRPRAYALLIALVACVAQAACGGGDSVVFLGGTVLMGDDLTPVADATLTVAGGRITCIGAAETCEVPPGADRIDASGFWIAPGLTDSHIHPRFGRSPDLTFRDQQLRFLLGVTLTRDASTADELEANLGASEQANDATLALPRVLVAGRAPLDAIAEDGTGAGVAIEELAGFGVAAIKVHEAFPPVALDSIVAAASPHGLQVYGHAWVDDPTRSLVSESVRAGFSGLSHLLGISALVVPEAGEIEPAELYTDAWRVWRRSLWLEADTAVIDSVARELARAGVWIEPLLASEHLWAEPYRFPPGLHAVFTLPFVADASQRGPDVAFSEEDRERLGRSMQRIHRFVRVFHEAGGRLVTGSDQAIAPGLVIHEELRLLTVAGLTPKAALMSATIDAARAMGVADSLGSIEVGKIADFVVLEGDPILDVANLQLVSRVAKGGVLHDPSSLLESLHDDLRDRTTSSAFRLLVGLFATLFVAGGTLVMIRVHARGQARTR